MEDLQSRPHLERIMLRPYARIFRMHFTIILGAAFTLEQFALFFSSNQVTLLLFLLMKTAVDWNMEAAEHEGSG